MWIFIVCRYWSMNGQPSGQRLYLILLEPAKPMNLYVKTTWLSWNYLGKVYLQLHCLCTCSKIIFELNDVKSACFRYNIYWNKDKNIDEWVLTEISVTKKKTQYHSRGWKSWLHYCNSKAHNKLSELTCQ